MKVPWYACACGCSQVITDIKGVGLERQSQQFFSFEDGLAQVGILRWFQILKITDFPVRDAKQVTGVVGKLVHDKEAGRTFIEKERFFRVFRFRDAKKGISAGFALLGGFLDVGHAPVGVQVFVRHAQAVLGMFRLWVADW